MTQIDIISGFLGAGKTTLIKKLLDEAFHGQKIVLIENEFGEIGIDGGFLKDAGVEITEMNSGCICCSLVGDFGTALKQVLADYAPDRIVIEPSGVGKLSDVIAAVERVQKEAPALQLHSFVTVVDATKAKIYMKNFGEFFNDQVEHASAILLSRTQNMDQAKLNASRAVSESFEPGSVGKIITMSGLLQTGLHKATDKFTVPYSYTKDGQEYHDSSAHGDEHWTLAGIIKNSSNVGVVMASSQYTKKQRYEYLTKFGIGQSSGMSIPGESRGQLGTPESWDGRTGNTILFGQGYSVNALQLTNVVATIGNKGVRKQQSLIKSVTHADGTVETPQEGSSTRVIDESVADQVKNAMESVAEGYSKVVNVKGYRIAAKTGTAEVAGSDGRLTSIVADFAGMIPADNPRFAITVIMKDPQGTYGGMTAGPVFAKIGEFLMQKYNVPTSSPRNDAIAVDW